MNFPIHYLNILILAATAYPSELYGIFLNFFKIVEKSPAARYIFMIIVYVVLILAVFMINSECLKLLVEFNLGLLIVSAVIGGALILGEYLIGCFIVFIKYKKILGIKLNIDLNCNRFIFLSNIIIIAVLEEIIFRQIWYNIIVNFFNLNIIIFIILSTLTYSFNHLYFGGFTVIQKILSGVIFSVLFICSGSIIVPIVTHVFQNLLLFIIGGGLKCSVQPT